MKQHFPAARPWCTSQLAAALQGRLGRQLREAMARRDTVVGISSTTEIWKIKSAERSPTSLRLQQCGELSLGNLNLFFSCILCPEPCRELGAGHKPKAVVPRPSCAFTLQNLPAAQLVSHSQGFPPEAPSHKTGLARGGAGCLL